MPWNLPCQSQSALQQTRETGSRISRPVPVLILSSRGCLSAVNGKGVSCPWHWTFNFVLRKLTKDNFSLRIRVFEHVKVSRLSFFKFLFETSKMSYNKIIKLCKSAQDTWYLFPNCRRKNVTLDPFSQWLFASVQVLYHVLFLLEHLWQKNEINGFSYPTMCASRKKKKKKKKL